MNESFPLIVTTKYKQLFPRIEQNNTLKVYHYEKLIVIKGKILQQKYEMFRTRMCIRHCSSLVPKRTKVCQEKK